MKLRCKVGLHAWSKVGLAGFNTYYECDYCTKRRVVSSPNCYTPIDHEFVAGRKDTIGNSVPNPPKAK